MIFRKLAFSILVFLGRTYQESWGKIRSVALAEFKDARIFLIVCPAVEETRSEGADVDGIHKILLVRKADKILQ